LTLFFLPYLSNLVLIRSDRTLVSTHRNMLSLLVHNVLSGIIHPLNNEGLASFQQLNKRFISIDRIRCGSGMLSPLPCRHYLQLRRTTSLSCQAPELSLAFFCLVGSLPVRMRSSVHLRSSPVRRFCGLRTHGIWYRPDNCFGPSISGLLKTRCTTQLEKQATIQAVYPSSLSKSQVRYSSSQIHSRNVHLKAQGGFLRFMSKLQAQHWASEIHILFQINIGDPPPVWDRV
jgi:hypothetical protein